MKNGKLQVCVVGCGDMGGRHAAAWQSLPQAEVLAVVDMNPARAQALAQKVGAPHGFGGYRPALELPGLDVVSVCIPTCYHAEVSIAAARAGKHVFCEKPVALCLEDAQAMTAAAEASGVKLGIGFIRRHSPVMQALRERLQAGDFGRPVLYTSVDARELRPKRMMHDASQTGGSVVDMGVHVYDGWSYIFDSQPVSVYAQGLKLVQGRTEVAEIADLAYDTAAITVRYASGDIGSFWITWGLPPGVQPAPQPDRIYGPQALGEVDYELDHQELRRMAGGRAGGGSGWEVLAVCEEDMYRMEIDAFARSILEDRPPLTTGEQGRDALRVGRAALESIRSGKVVLLDSMEREHGAELEDNPSLVY